MDESSDRSLSVSGSFYSNSLSKTLLDNLKPTTTYGELVDQIHASGLPIYAYHDVYLRTHTSAPPKETRPAAFVSKGDRLGAGVDFNVFAGQLFENHDNLPSIFRMKHTPNEEYGDHEFRAGGASGGGGSFSSMGSRSEPTQVPVALKESVQSIHKSGNRPVVLDTFIKEIRVLGKLKSRTDIVHIFGVAFTEIGDEVKPTLVVELALCDLIDFFKLHLSIINWELKSHFAIHISEALDAVHSCGITHADIKGQNVLVVLSSNGQFRAKLSDFGHSGPTNASPSEGGTTRYLAPECLRGDMVPKDNRDWWTLYGNGIYRDIYALGLVIWEMATNYRSIPFSGMSDKEVALMKYDDRRAVTTHFLACIRDDTPQYILDIIRGALQTDPIQRIPLSTLTQKLRDGMKVSTSPILASADSFSPLSQFTDLAMNEDPLLNVPLSLQSHLYEESLNSSERDVKAKVFLAYCYVLASDHDQIKDQAVRLLRSAAKHNAFYITPGSKLSPFRALMEMYDWDGLAEIFRMLDDESSNDSYLRHIYSFGWNKLLVYACMGGYAALEGNYAESHVKANKTSSEEVAVKVMQLLVASGHEGFGAASLGYYGDDLTALHGASATGKLRASSMLLANGANVNAFDGDGRSALHLCCRTRTLSDDLSTEVSKIFVKYHPDVVNAGMKYRRYTPLRFAVEAQKPSLCGFLIEQGADVNARADNDSTILQQCASKTMDKDMAITIAQLILKSGRALINMSTGHNSLTALGVAVNGGFHEMVAVLLKSGADPNIPFDGHPLVCLAVGTTNDDPETSPSLGLLLQHGASTSGTVDKRHFSTNSFSAIHFAAARCLITPLKTLLEHDTSLSFNVRTKSRQTALHIAIVCTSEISNERVLPIVEFLIQHGVDLDAVDDEGYTALHLSCMHRLDGIVHRLLDARSNIHILTPDGRHPLWLYFLGSWWAREKKLPRLRSTLRALCHRMDRSSNIPAQIQNLIMEIV